MKRAPFLLLAALLAACGDDAPPPIVPDEDPALSRALAEPLLTDPDLTSLNRANAVADIPSQDRSLPSIEAGPEALAGAREDALRLVGGAGRMQRAPEPREVASALPNQGDCAARTERTMRWAARMPAAFPVYPRGAALEAAGTDKAGCALRVVKFVTPVPLGEVIDFYFTRARGAGYSAAHLLQDGDNVLAGKKGAASYVIHARRLPSGNTEVDLVTVGG